MAFTNCSSGGSGGDCLLDSSRPNRICRVKVWDRPWLKNKTVTELGCRDAEVGGDYQGFKPETSKFKNVGVEKKDLLVGDIESYADLVLAAVEKSANSGEKLAVLKVLASSVKIVAGKDVRLTLEIGAILCGENATEVCPVDVTKPVQVCNARILEQPWLEKREITSLSCKAKPKTKSLGLYSVARRRRQASGEGHTALYQDFFPKGYKELSLDDPVVAEMSDFAAQAIAQRDKVSLTLTKVNAAGTLLWRSTYYRFVMELEGDSGAIICKAEVVELPPIVKRSLKFARCNKLQSKRIAEIDPEQSIARSGKLSNILLFVPWLIFLSFQFPS